MFNIGFECYPEHPTIDEHPELLQTLRTTPTPCMPPSPTATMTMLSPFACVSSCLDLSENLISRNNGIDLLCTGIIGLLSIELASIHIKYMLYISIL